MGAGLHERGRTSGARAVMRRARVAWATRSIEPRMLWILGSPRSGSTWLLDMLATHPNVVPVNEPLLGAYLSPFLADLPGWDGGSLDAGNFTLRKMQADNPNQFFATEFEHAWLPGLAGMIRRRFAAHAIRFPAPVRLGERIYAIKEPNGSESADLIMRALPEARLLNLVRDPRDIVDSELASNMKGAWVTEAFAGAGGLDGEARLEFVRWSSRRWLWRTAMVEEAYAAHPGPKLTLRYEELRADPIAGMRTAFEWLALDPDGDEVHRGVEGLRFESLPQELRGEGKFRRSAQPGRWKESLSDAEQQACIEIVGGKLIELGYDVEATGREAS